jgi:hypothetical protein
MKTEDLIKAIATDTSAPAMSMGRAWRVSVTAAVAVAAVVFFAMIGPRPDIASAVETVRFLRPAHSWRLRLSRAPSPPAVRPSSFSRRRRFCSLPRL